MRYKNFQHYFIIALFIIFARPSCGDDSDSTRSLISARICSIPVEKDISIEFVHINAGEFMMGASDSSNMPAEAYEKPRHKVQLSEFWIGITEITVGQFRCFVKATGYVTDAEKEGGSGGVRITALETSNWKGLNWRNPEFKQIDEEPVVCISWNDAMAFCKWISKISDREITLPSEAQWEYVGLAGSDGPWGVSLLNNRMDQSDFTDLLSEYAWWEENSIRRTQVVMHRYPNDFFVDDMLGNVREWCQDYYLPDFYSKSPLKDPLNTTSWPGLPYKEPSGQRVLRGGSWCRNRYSLEPSDTRAAAVPGSSWTDCGFRICCKENLGKFYKTVKSDWSRYGYCGLDRSRKE